MTIKMPKAKIEADQAAQNFIAAAPDATAAAAGSVAAPTRRGVLRGKREQITHTLPTELLDRIDAQAQGRGMTRAGFINFAISRALDELQS